MLIAAIILGGIFALLILTMLIGLFLIRWFLKHIDPGNWRW
jgi:hypothetical protein